MIRPSNGEIALYGLFWICASIWGLFVFAFRDPTSVHWAEFAYGFLGFSSAATIGTLGMCNFWAIRARFLNGQEVPNKENLERTHDFNLAGMINGVSERFVFTTLAVMLVEWNSYGPFHVSGNVGVLASIAGGWIVLKSLAGWRRSLSEEPAMMTLSTASIAVSLTSVFLGVLGGVLTLGIFFGTP